MRLSEAAIVTKGRVVGQDVLFNSVGTDSRSLSQGQLFVALKGEHFDGHAYVQQSLAQGALAAMVSVDDGISPALLVADTRLSLGDLAAHWRQKFTTYSIVAASFSAGMIIVTIENNSGVLKRQISGRAFFENLVIYLSVSL